VANGNFSTAYSASKWAVEGLSRSAAYVYADWGIRCNVIQPWFIETDMTAKINSNPVMRTMSKHTMSNTILLRRTGRAEEIATTALFLASDDSSCHYGCADRRNIDGYLAHQGPPDR
jgi:NAD(P)-dependent dehydrogenase (short-subunit alcohol dehydrogenase family)